MQWPRQLCLAICFLRVVLDRQTVSHSVRCNQAVSVDDVCLCWQPCVSIATVEMMLLFSWSCSCAGQGQPTGLPVSHASMSEEQSHHQQSYPQVASQSQPSSMQAVWWPAQTAALGCIPECQVHTCSHGPACCTHNVQSSGLCSNSASVLRPSLVRMFDLCQHAEMCTQASAQDVCVCACVRAYVHA